VQEEENQKKNKEKGYVLLPKKG